MKYFLLCMKLSNHSNPADLQYLITKDSFPRYKITNNLLMPFKAVLIMTANKHKWMMVLRLIILPANLSGEFFMVLALPI